MQGTESEEKSDGRTAADFCMQRRGGAGGRELGQAFLVMKLSLGLMFSITRSCAESIGS